MLLDNSKKVELIKYLPLFMQMYKEIQAIMGSENPIVQDEWDKLKQAFKNNFMFLTDIKGISMFEEMMDIYPIVGSTLSDRQIAVYTKWNTSLPYTWEWLLEFLGNYFSNSTTTWNALLRHLVYELDIELIKNVEFGALEYALYPYLRGAIPANLVLNLINSKEESGTYYLCPFEIQMIEEEYYPDGKDSTIDSMYYLCSFEIQMIEEEYYPTVLDEIFKSSYYMKSWESQEIEEVNN